MKRRICVEVTARPSYARIKTALQAIREHPDLELQLVVAASAVLERYGEALKYIRSDGFDVAASVFMVLEGELHLVIHLMIAGRLQWRPVGAKPAGKAALAVFEFDAGSLVLTEAGTQRRASLHLLHGRAALAAADPGGIDVFASDLAGFVQRLAAENHTLKRALTNPRLFSGIGNAYSDEILHRARLSPLQLTRKLDDAGVARLFEAARSCLTDWSRRLITEVGAGFPEKVTAFRPGMAVHGRYKEPCPDCGAPVQRIVHADNETNSGARCQTGGRLLADRALSRLLKDDWPRSLDEL